MVTPAKRKKVKNPSLKKSRKTANKHFKKMAKPSGGDAISDIMRQTWARTVSVKKNYHSVGLMTKLNIFSTGNKGAEYETLGLSANDLKERWSKELDGGYLNHLEHFPSVKPTVVEYADVVRDENGNIVSYEVVKAEKDVKQEEKSKTVQELEQLAKTAWEYKKPVHLKPAEIEFVKKCKEKYGDNIEKIARDIKLNIYQHTEGQIRRLYNKFAELNKV